MRLFSRKAAMRMLWLVAALTVLLGAAWWFMLRMPGESYKGDAPDPNAALMAELRKDVEHLCGKIGERNVYRPKKLAAAADWIEAELKKAGYAPQRQVYDVKGVACANIEAVRKGNGEIVIVGAHYDSVPGCPGANDNGSGVVATLALARRFAKRETKRTLRFVLFVNEEPPWFQTDDMGSMRYAKRCRERKENVVAMVSLETLGYFTDQPNSQKYPVKPLRYLYGDRGDFVGFVGNVGSRDLVRDALKVFREHAKIPSQGVALMDAVPGIGWSDHWAFWQHDYDGIMVTDTAPFRYPHYHEATDTPDQLRYDKLAHVVESLVPVVEALAVVQ